MVTFEDELYIWIFLKKQLHLFYVSQLAVTKTFLNFNNSKFQNYLNAKTEPIIYNEHCFICKYKIATLSFVELQFENSFAPIFTL